MNSKIEYFKNILIKKEDSFYVLNENDGHVNNFGKQWRDYRDVQIDSKNNFNISKEYLREMFFGNIDLIRNKEVLEIGSGAGGFTEYFSKLSKMCVSIDLSSSVFYNVSKGSENIIIIKSDFNELIPNKKFDIVFCRGVLQHTKDPLKSLLKIHEFVKDEGIVVFDIYKMPKLGYAHPKYFFWRPIINFLFKYEIFENYLKANIKKLLKLKRSIKKILFNSDFLSDCIIPIWDYKNKLKLSDELLEDWAIMDTLDGIYAKYDYPQRNKKIFNYLIKNNINVLKNNKNKNIFLTKIK